jgi:GntR family transcriptional regulator
MSITSAPSVLPINRAPRIELELSLVRLLNSLNPGDRLPPEPDLAKQLGVSRAMLREVVTGLVERGLLIRRQGIGTFVASQTPFFNFGLEVLESLDSLARRTGMETEVSDLEIRPRKWKSEEIALLQIDVVYETVLEVSRVISIKGKPIAYLVDIVPNQYLSQTEVEASIHGSVYDLLTQKGEIPLAYSRTEIMAVNANSKLGKRLHVSIDTALILLTAQLFTNGDQVVDLSYSYFVPGQFKFHVMRRLSKPIDG